MHKFKALKDELFYQETLDNGLKVYIHPKAGFIDYYCTLQVHMGGHSLDYQYGNDEFKLPDGSAHFLEHVYFENDGISLMDTFSKLNADVNASTSRDVTKYYFKTQSNFIELLKLFLTHFSNVLINEKTVEKERQIIKKEIMMYDDNLYDKAYGDLTKHMFQDRKIWADIAGTLESVNQIGVEELQRAVRHFYQPRNMVLVITGPVNKEEVITSIKASDFNRLKGNEYEPKIVYSLHGHKNHHIFKSNKNQDVEYIMLGLKINLSDFNHLSVSQKRLSIIMFFEYFFDESSMNYKELKEAKLINYMYSTNVYINHDYAYFMVSSESQNPKKLKERLIEMLFNLKKIDKNIFIAFKRSRIGSFIGYFDSPQSINHTLSDFIKKDIDIEKYIEHVNNIDLNDLDIVRKSIVKDNIYSVIYAKK